MELRGCRRVEADLIICRRFGRGAGSGRRAEGEWVPDRVRDGEDLGWIVGRCGGFEGAIMLGLWVVCAADVVILTGDGAREMVEKMY